MQTKAIGAAIAGGVIGALIWGAISHFTGYEVGYVAWGIGGLVGWLATVAGGSGFTTAAAAGAIALVSIAGGKLLATKFAIDASRAELAAELESAADEFLIESGLFYDLSSEDEYPEFMIAHGYSESDDASDVSQDEIDYFKATAIPVYEEIRDGEKDPEILERIYADRVISTNLAEIGFLQLAFGGQEPGDYAFDLLFAALGIFTAFKLVAREEETA